MPIKIIDKKSDENFLKYGQLQMGHAYRLVKSDEPSQEGMVYTPMRWGNMFNFNTSAMCNCLGSDRWVEVDMEIIIKEKS